MDCVISLLHYFKVVILKERPILCYYLYIFLIDGSVEYHGHITNNKNYNFRTHNVLSKITHSNKVNMEEGTV